MPLLLQDITQPFHTDISQKPIIPIFKSEEIQIHYIWTKTNKGTLFFFRNNMCEKMNTCNSNPGILQKSAPGI